MPLLNLALDLPGAEITALMEEIVDELLANISDMANDVYSDGIFPGTYPLTGPQALGQYLENTDPMDYEKLFDDDYLLRLQNGLDAPPVSQYWLAQLSDRTSYDRNRNDFQRLITQSQGRRERYR